MYRRDEEFIESLHKNSSLISSILVTYDKNSDVYTYNVKFNYADIDEITVNLKGKNMSITLISNNSIRVYNIVDADLYKGIMDFINMVVRGILINK